MHGIVALGGGGDEHAIDPSPFGPCVGFGNGIFSLGEINHLGPKGSGQFTFGGIKVNTQYATAIGAQHLNTEQTNQPKARDHDGLPKRGFQKTDPLKSDGTHNGEGRFLIGNLFRDPTAKVFGDADELCMMPIGHDSVPLLESSFGNVGTRVQNSFPHCSNPWAGVDRVWIEPLEAWA